MGVWAENLPEPPRPLGPCFVCWARNFSLLSAISQASANRPLKAGNAVDFCGCAFICGTIGFYSLLISPGKDRPASWSWVRSWFLCKMTFSWERWRRVKGKGSDTETTSWADPAPGDMHQDQCRLGRAGDVAPQVDADGAWAFLDVGESLMPAMQDHPSTFSWQYLKILGFYRIFVVAQDVPKKNNNHQGNPDQAGRLQSSSILCCCASERQSLS